MSVLGAISKSSADNQRPCVGCGYCCQTATCAFGELAGSDSKECKYLRRNGDRYFCHLVECFPDVYKEPLAIGAGCCSSLFNKQRDAMIRR